LRIETPEIECEDGSMVSPLSAFFVVSSGQRFCLAVYNLLVKLHVNV